MLRSARLYSFLLVSLITIVSYAEGNLINQVRVGGGPATGEYTNIAASLCALLGQLFQCQSIETSGTVDNRQKLEARQVDIALAKSNIADEWMKDARFSSKYQVVRRIGDESLFVFGKPETIQAVGSWMGVRENPSLLNIGLPGALSGDAAVFNSLKSLPGSPLAKLAVTVFQDRPALVEAVRTGKVKLGFITQVPNPNNPLFQSINTASLMLMGVVDPDMVTAGDTFRIKPVTVKNAKWFGVGGVAQQIETANVSVAIVAIKPEALQGRAAIVQQAAIKRIQDAEESDLLPHENWMQNLANTASLRTSASLSSLINSLEASATGARGRIEKLCAVKP